MLFRHKRMELRHLRYFAAVAEAGNVSRAARQLRVTQPALSRQIQDLERDLACRLFDRIGRRIVLTKDGDYSWSGRGGFWRTPTPCGSVRELSPAGKPECSGSGQR